MNTKKCYKCQQELPLEQFSKHSGKPDGLNSQCKQCHKVLRREHYLKHRQKYIDKADVITRAFRDWWHEYKQQFKCTYCEERHPACIQFHHIDPAKKEAEIASLVHNGSKTNLLKELEKCIPVCANCHCKIHYQR